MKINTTTKYNWKKYNNNNILLSKKLETFNNLNNLNFVENSYYNHTRDLLALTLISEKKINILDFGSNIVAISNLKNKINIKDIKFYIFDPFSNKNLLKVKSLKGLNVIYCNDLSKINDISFDIVHFGSSIQYLAKYENLIKKINFKKKSTILVTATPMTTSLHYKVDQKNHKNLIQNIHNLNDLSFFLKKFKFKLIFKSAFSIKLASLKTIKKNTFFLNLLYKK